MSPLFIVVVVVVVVLLQLIKLVPPLSTQRFSWKCGRLFNNVMRSIPKPSFAANFCYIYVSIEFGHTDCVNIYIYI